MISLLLFTGAGIGLSLYFIQLASSWRHLRETAAPYLTPIEALAFRHAVLRVETELAWHDEFLQAMPKMFTAEDAVTP